MSAPYDAKAEAAKLVRFIHGDDHDLRLSQSVARIFAAALEAARAAGREEGEIAMRERAADFARFNDPNSRLAEELRALKTGLIDRLTCCEANKTIRHEIKIKDKDIKDMKRQNVVAVITEQVIEKVTEEKTLVEDDGEDDAFSSLMGKNVVLSHVRLLWKTHRSVIGARPPGRRPRQD